MTKIPDDFKPVLEKLIRSHKKLSSAEYKRNSGYNNRHYSHIAEDELIKWLIENGEETFLSRCCKTESQIQAEDLQCPVCGFYCLGNGGLGCIDKPYIVKKAKEER